MEIAQKIVNNLINVNITVNSFEIAFYNDWLGKSTRQADQ